MTHLTDKDLNFVDVWNSVLENIKGSLSKSSFDTWISPLTAQIEDEDLLVICAQNEFAKEWVETRYKNLLFEKIRKTAGRTFEIDFISIEREKNTAQTIFKLDKRQALGYFFLACKEANLPKDSVTELYKNICWQFDLKSPEEAEKQGYNWYETL
jgi:chromosomal replication initiation ATPase DnaA